MENSSGSTSRQDNRWILIINLFLTVSTFVILAFGLAEGPGEGQPGWESLQGLNYLKPFTVQSNLLCGVAAFAVAVFSLTNAAEGTDLMPEWAVVFQYTASCAVGLTFMTVVLFLGPLRVIEGKDYFALFKGEMFFFHFLNPVLSGISMVLLGHHRLTRTHQVIGEIPTVFYSFLYFIEVIVLKNWSDFYNFTLDGKPYMIPAAFIMTYGLTWLAGFLLKRGHNRYLDSGSRG